MMAARARVGRASASTRISIFLAQYEKGFMRVDTITITRANHHAPGSRNRTGDSPSPGHFRLAAAIVPRSGTVSTAESLPRSDLALALQGCVFHRIDSFLVLYRAS